MNPKKFHIILFLISFISIATGLPSRRFREIDESSVTTRIIDLNNPEDKGLLQKFNISAEQLRQIQSARQSSSGAPSTDENDRLSDIKEMRFQDIKIKIENAISPNLMNNENIIHEMAAYPSCGQLNESSWQEENNITIRFAASLFENPHPDMYLDTAVLRLFKLDPQAPIRTTPRSANCEDIPIESQIRVTVSTIQQLRRNRRVNNPFDHFSAERKKRICNTIMLNVSQTGWVEIDVKKAINLWEKAERPSRNANYNNNNNRPVMVGWLTIEVHDEEERPLKTGLYFEPPKCSEADAAIPWNFYRIYASSPSTDMEKVPRSPRLDIKLITKNVSPTHRHTHHRNVYRHSSNPLCTDQLPITDSLEFPEVRNHKKRHEQSHHARHHHHHHSERRQDTTDDNPHQQN